MRPRSCGREDRIEVLELGLCSIPFGSGVGFRFNTCLVRPETVVFRLSVLFHLLILINVIDNVLFNIIVHVRYLFSIRKKQYCLKTEEGGDSD